MDLRFDDNEYERIKSDVTILLNLLDSFQYSTSKNGSNSDLAAMMNCCNKISLILNRTSEERDRVVPKGLVVYNGKS